jgi:hypothetical protein
MSLEAADIDRRRNRLPGLAELSGKRKYAADHPGGAVMRLEILAAA